MGRRKTAARNNGRKRQKAAVRQFRVAISHQLQDEYPVSVVAFGTGRYNMMREANPITWEKAYGMVHGLVKPDRNAMRQPYAEGLDPIKFVEDIYTFARQEPLIADVEEKFLHKFGDYAKAGYDAWRHKVMDHWKDVSFHPDHQTLEWAKDVVFEELNALGPLTPLTIDDSLELVTKGRNSGWPYFTKKWHHKHLDYYANEAEGLLQGHLEDHPMILLKRVQPNGNFTVDGHMIGNAKMRPVMCPPKSEAIAAKCFAEPLLIRMKQIPRYYGFNGGTRIHKVIPLLAKYKYWVESDFSSFDQNCKGLFPHAMEVITRLFPNNMPYWERVLDYYTWAPLITPDGIITGLKPSGLPSGGGWTSMIGTICNAIATTYTLARMGLEPNEYTHFAFGDDIALGCDSFDAAAFEERMAEVGMECNKSKQSVSEGSHARISFLGYYHFRHLIGEGCTGLFPATRLASGLFFKEFYLEASPLHDELEDFDLTEEEIEDIKSASISDIIMMGIASRLRNLEGHSAQEDITSYMCMLFPNLRELPYKLGLTKVLETRMSGRWTRGTSFEDTNLLKFILKDNAF